MRGREECCITIRLKIPRYGAEHARILQSLLKALLGLLKTSRSHRSKVGERETNPHIGFRNESCRGRIVYGALYVSFRLPNVFAYDGYIRNTLCGSCCLF